MRIDEFEKDALKQLADSRNLSEEQLDEILPALAMAARAVGAGVGAAARGAASIGGAAARGLGKAAAGGAKQLGKAAVKSVAKSVAGDDKETNDPNATVGTQDEPNTTTGQPMGQDIIRPGKTLNMPGAKGALKVSNVRGDEVELTTLKPQPGQPRKVTYKKDELGSLINNET